MPRKAAEAPAEEKPDDKPEEKPDDKPEQTPVISNADRFFTWMRSLGLDRQPGWVGGVCAGIAARLGIDPLIVRGIVVVIAVLGGPAFLLYAVAWLLLPDTKNKIHLEELLRGRFESPIAGIGVLVLLSLLPITQGFWYAGAAYWGEPAWGASIGRTLWTIALLALAVWFVVWVARRSNRGESPTYTPTYSPATTDDRPETIPQPVPERAAFTERKPEPRPGPDASQSELDDWRARQQQWRDEREAFRQQRAATAQEAHRVRVAEARSRAEAATAERRERRRREALANPRAGAAYSAIVLGASAIAGGVAFAVASGDPYLQGFELTAALAVALLVIAIAVVAAAVIRRRTAFLGFVSVVLVLATVGAAVVPQDRQLLPPLVSYGLSNATPGKFTSLAGNLDVTIDAQLPTDGGVIDIWQATGSITLWLGAGTTTRVEIVSGTGQVVVGTSGDGMTSYTELPNQRIVDDMWRSTTTFGADTKPDVIIRIWQGRGSISVLDSSFINPQGDQE